MNRWAPPGVYPRGGCWTILTHCPPGGGSSTGRDTVRCQPWTCRYWCPRNERDGGADRGQGRRGGAAGPPRRRAPAGQLAGGRLRRPDHRGRWHALLGPRVARSAPRREPARLDRLEAVRRAGLRARAVDARPLPILRDRTLVLPVRNQRLYGPNPAGLPGFRPDSASVLPAAPFGDGRRVPGGDRHSVLANAALLQPLRPQRYLHGPVHAGSGDLPLALRGRRQVPLPVPYGAGAGPRLRHK